MTMVRKTIILVALVVSIIQVGIGLTIYLTKNYSIVWLHAIIGTLLGILIIAGLILGWNSRLLRTHFLSALILIVIQSSIFLNVIANIDPWYFLGGLKGMIHLILGFLIMFIMIGATAVEFIVKKK
jgi:hypothetical protein